MNFSSNPPWGKLVWIFSGFRESQTHTLGCFDDGVDDDDEGLVGDPESFRTFFSFKGGESGPFSTLAGELASWETNSNPI